jgi:ATP-dependent exoDNAse (exonuclease V) beta subunit
MLMSCRTDASTNAIAKFAVMHARILGATEAEATAAIAVVAHALTSPLMRRAAGAAQIRREAPVLIRLDDGVIVEGVADLAFMERDGWTVVDFKTDVEIALRLDEYRAQLGLYLRGIRAASGQAARGVLLWL